MSKDGKQLTDLEMIKVISNAPNEIECADAYRHFLEDLGDLIASHFGGERGMVTEPADSYTIVYVCDNCDCRYVRDESGEWDGLEIIELQDCKGLYERLEPGSTVPDGECPECGAFVYNVPSDECSWMCSFEHNECVPSDGGVFKDFDTDINWEEEEQQT